MISRSIILIPTLNERENLENLIPAIFGLIPNISVLVIDDNSMDGTPELVEDLKQSYNNFFILKRVEDFGYGRACIDGFQWALERHYDYLVTMDADFSHDFKIIPDLIGRLDDFDIIIGSRYVSGGKIRNWKWYRKTLSRFANFYVRTILRIPIRDATTGFNAYRAAVLNKINLRQIKSDGYAFLVELKYSLFKAECMFIEYPIIFSERREGKSKMSFRVIWESLWFPWKIILNKK